MRVDLEDGSVNIDGGVYRFIAKKIYEPEGETEDQPMATTRSEILDRAKRLVVGDREKSYGSPEENFKRICSMWNTYLGRRLTKKLTPADVGAMMCLLKLARIGSGIYSEDNWTDLAGYAACGGELASFETDEKEDKEEG